jgi:hypothetical protein
MGYLDNAHNLFCSRPIFKFIISKKEHSGNSADLLNKIIYIYRSQTVLIVSMFSRLVFFAKWPPLLLSGERGSDLLWTGSKIGTYRSGSEKMDYA